MLTCDVVSHCAATLSSLTLSPIQRILIIVCAPQAARAADAAASAAENASRLSADVASLRSKLSAKEAELDQVRSPGPSTYSLRPCLTGTFETGPVSPPAAL